MNTDPELIRETLREIMSRDEYQELSAPWAYRIWEFLLRLISKIFSLINIRPSETQESWLYPVAAIFLVIVFVIFLVFIATRVRRVFIKKQRTITQDVGLAPEVWQERYESAYQSGNMKEAFRCLWRLTVVELDRSGLLVERRGLTTGEAIKEAKLEGNAFTDFTLLFEKAFYARQDIGKDQVDMAKNWRDDIKREGKR